MCGIHHAKGRYVITIDDDLQYKPEDIPLLINEIKKGFDVVFGIQDTKKQKLWRQLLSFLFQIYYKLTFHYQDRVSSFRILSSDICLQLKSFGSSFVYINGIINWYTNKISGLKIQHQVRPHGKSGYSFKKLLSFFLNIVATYSFFPFRSASIVGIVLTSAGFILGLFSIIRYLAEGTVDAVAGIFIPILFLSGFVLLFLGIAGEYIVRIKLDFMDKPQYCIRNEYREGKKDQGSN
jgi:undecaprenyl-phosphate 4-deoxy-4-formamido-L-arabinose transferase